MSELTRWPYNTGDQMHLKFGVLADYAGPGAANKGILVGIFDSLYNPQNLQQIVSPAFFLYASVEAHVTEGSEHRATIQLLTADGRELSVPVKIELPFKFAPRGPGRAMQGNLILGFQGLPLPGNGTYEFNILMDGRHLGSVPLYVSEPPQAPHS